MHYAVKGTLLSANLIIMKFHIYAIAYLLMSHLFCHTGNVRLSSLHHGKQYFVHWTFILDVLANLVGKPVILRIQKIHILCTVHIPRRTQYNSVLF